MALISDCCYKCGCPLFYFARTSRARLWTLIASAERNGLDPQRYLTSVLAKIGSTPMSELEQFLPEVWKAEDPVELLPASDSPASVNS